MSRRSHSLVVYTDGAARGNPGPAGIGVYVTTPDGSVVSEIAGGIGRATNNVAEYTAAIRGLERAAELGASDVTLRSDSQLLIEQLARRYRVRTPHLKPLHEQVMRLASRFDTIRFEHVRREANVEADRLANEGVDAWLASDR